LAITISRNLLRASGRHLVGVDTRTPIDDCDYQVPFCFTGKLNKLTVEEGSIKGTLAQILEFKWKPRA
jgi:hypothetical protein